MSGLSEYEQHARDKAARDVDHAADLRRLQAENATLRRRLLDQGHAAADLHTLRLTLALIVAEDGKDRRGKRARNQVQAVREVLGRVAP